MENIFKRGDIVSVSSRSGAENMYIVLFSAGNADDFVSIIRILNYGPMATQDLYISEANGYINPFNGIKYTHFSYLNPTGISISDIGMDRVNDIIDAANRGKYQYVDRKYYLTSEDTDKNDYSMESFFKTMEKFFVGKFESEKRKPAETPVVPEVSAPEPAMQVEKTDKTTIIKHPCGSVTVIPKPAVKDPPKETKHEEDKEPKLKEKARPVTPSPNTKADKKPDTLSADEIKDITSHYSSFTDNNERLDFIFNTMGFGKTKRIPINRVYDDLIKRSQTPCKIQHNTILLTMEDFIFFMHEDIANIRQRAIITQSGRTVYVSKDTAADIKRKCKSLYFGYEESSKHYIDEKVKKDIIELYNNGNGFSYTEIANQYGMTYNSVYRIINIQESNRQNHSNDEIINDIIARAENNVDREDPKDVEHLGEVIKALKYIAKNEKFISVFVSGSEITPMKNYTGSKNVLRLVSGVIKFKSSYMYNLPILYPELVISCSAYLKFIVSGITKFFIKQNSNKMLDLALVSKYRDKIDFAIAPSKISPDKGHQAYQSLFRYMKLYMKNDDHPTFDSLINSTSGCIKLLKSYVGVPNSYFEYFYNQFGYPSQGGREKVN